jgi:hypothetical protein
MMDELSIRPELQESFRRSLRNPNPGAEPVPGGGSAPPASETVAGIAELATAPEVMAGVSANTIVTPATLATLVGAATLTVPGPAGRFEHSETFAVPNATATSRVAVWLQPGTDTDENVAEMLDVVALWAQSASGSITIGASFREPTSGGVKVLYEVR